VAEEVDELWARAAPEPFRGFDIDRCFA